MDYLNFRNLHDQEKIKVNTTCTSYERIKIQEFGESSGQAPRQKQDSSMKTEPSEGHVKETPRKMLDITWPYESSPYPDYFSE